MPTNAIDLTALLDAPSEEFLPRAYQEIIGREPDAGGLLHYIVRLKKGLPRELILAEMRHSAEGQAIAFIARSEQLDALHASYLKLRDLPLGKLRWKLLPRFGQQPHNDARFDWTGWVNAFTDRQQAQKFERLREQQQPALQAAAQDNPPSSELRQQLHEIATALQVAAAALQSKGAPESAVRPLREASASLQAPHPDVSAVPWEARQALHWLAQAVRS